LIEEVANWRVNLAMQPPRLDRDRYIVLVAEAEAEKRVRDARMSENGTRM
jgi:hypothetical protein